ncbi:hypothetical protein [Cryptosporangium sp. NPDC048952]|uniref:hypothetical protein n=1 Tax=Cryptosporangium sp. NPDC048952 TaxID=3363961 RepID=UPI003710178A
MTLALGSPKTLLHRWPTLLAIAVAAVSLSDGAAEPGVGVALVVAAAGYVVIAAFDRPALTWPMVVVLFGGVVALRAFEVPEVPVLVVIAAVGAVVVLVRRQSRMHVLQVPVGLLGLTVFAVALEVPTSVGAVVAALGLLGHAAWDAVLWRRGTVIARSFAEWCGVFDALVAVGLIVLVAAGPW